ncbi:MAG: helix-turn-helix transcriptional regulator [Pseudomonadales bacterium]|nr:helix-turn-helix transcriptional regulator [Pseudomonadales bacterium]MCP5182388.1 helix-turn-helix transcriptional regulator [Pseudomonadales bacterium]
MRSRTNQVSGVAEMLVLRCLSEREMYGYELVQAVRELSNGELDMRESLLYPLLHGLMADGCLGRKATVANGRQRLYYRLTAKGRRRLEAMIEEWRGMVKAVNRVIG